MIEQSSSMMPLPTSPSSSSSSSASSSSPRLLLLRSNSSEWHAVVQRNVKSSLLLLLVLSTIFVVSVLYSSSHAFVAPDQALTQSTDHGVTDRFVPGQGEADDEPISVPAENNEAPEQKSLAADISLPSADASAAPAVPASTTAEQTGDQSKCSFTVNSFAISKLYITLHYL